jgi:hypothetical protein
VAGAVSCQVGGTQWAGRAGDKPTRLPAISLGTFSSPAIPSGLTLHFHSHPGIPGRTRGHHTLGLAAGSPRGDSPPGRGASACVALRCAPPGPQPAPRPRAGPPGPSACGLRGLEKEGAARRRWRPRRRRRSSQGPAGSGSPAHVLPERRFPSLTLCKILLNMV